MGQRNVDGTVQRTPVRPRISDSSRFVPAAPGAPMCASLPWKQWRGSDWPNKEPCRNVPSFFVENLERLGGRIAGRLACGFDRTRVSRVERVGVFGSGTSEDMAAMLPHLRNDGRYSDRPSSRGIICFGQQSWSFVQSRETFQKPTEALKLELEACSLVG